MKRLFLIICFFYSGFVFADVELQTIVVTGRAAQTVQGDVAGTVGVLDQVALDLVRASHINEVADRVSGVWISRGNGQESLVSIRSPVFVGTGSCGEFMVLEDGIPTRPSGFCNVNQLFEINSEQAQRIEIFKGPNGGVYGNNALHGVINVISPAVTSDEVANVMLDGGPHDYARGFLSYSDGKSFRVNAHADHDGGYKDDAGFDQQKLNIKLLSQVNDHRVESFIEFTNLNQETAGYIDGDGAYKNDSQKKDNLNLDAFRDAQSVHGYSKIIFDQGNGREFRLTPYANTSQMEFSQHWLPTKPREKNGHVSAGLNGRYSYPIALSSGDDLSMVSGFNLEAGRAYIDEHQANLTQFGFTQGQHFDFDVDLRAAALFSELQYDLNPKLKLISGLRYDYQYYDYSNHTASNTVGNYTRLPDQDDDFGNWGVNAGLIWSWFERQQVFFNVANGYRTPDISELYRLEGGVPPSAVQSEEIKSIELGWRGELKPFLGERFFYELSLFDMRKDHVIFKKADRQYLGDGKTSHQGAEVTLNYWPTQQVYVRTAFTYAEHRYERVNGLLFASSSADINNKIMDTAPRFYGSLQVGREFIWGLVEFEVKNMGSYYLDPEHDWAYGGYTLLNLRALWKVRSDVQLSARVLNLADLDYAERADVKAAAGPNPEVPRYFVGEPRSLYLSIEKSF